MKNEAAWDLVVAHLHYNGEKREVLTAEQRWEVFCQGDGYGKRSPEELRKINSGWDWSHIRDSSDQAILHMATMLKCMEKGMTVKAIPECPEVQEHRSRHCYVSPTAYKGVRITYHGSNKV